MTEYKEVFNLIGSFSAVVAHVLAAIIFLRLTWENRHNKEKASFYLAMFAFVSGTQQYRPLA